MKIKLLHILAFSLVCLLFSCKQVEKQDNEIAVIKWDNNRDKLISELIDTTYYIPIETHPEGLFVHMDKIILTKDKIFILDYIRHNALLVFDRSGKFLFKVGQRGAGPEEYIGVMNFAVDDKHIYIIDQGTYNILVYDMKNSFVERLKNKTKIDDLAVTKDGFLAEYAYYQTKEKPDGDIGEYRLFGTDKKFKKKKDYLPINSDFSLLKKKSGISSYEDRILYHAFGMDYVVIFDRNNLESSKTYTFDFGDRSIPAEKRYDMSSMNDKKYDRLKSMFFGGKYILGEVNGTDVFVLDTDTKDVYRNIEMKFKSTGEPILPTTKEMEDVLSYPLAVYGDEIVSYVTGTIYKQMIDFGCSKADDATHTHLLADGDNMALLIKKFRQLHIILH